MSDKQAILCVDDDAIILMSLKQELLNHFNGRFLMETALNAEEALQIIDELCKDGVSVIMILTDWLMPGIKGDELVSIVKSRYPDIRCIIISGQADRNAIDEAKKNVLIDAFIPKPWNSVQLIESVTRCLGE